MHGLEGDKWGNHYVGLFFFFPPQKTGTFPTAAVTSRHSARRNTSRELHSHPHCLPSNRACFCTASSSSPASMKHLKIVGLPWCHSSKSRNNQCCPSEGIRVKPWRNKWWRCRACCQQWAPVKADVTCMERRDLIDSSIWFATSCNNTYGKWSTPAPLVPNSEYLLVHGTRRGKQHPARRHLVMSWSGSNVQGKQNHYAQAGSASARLLWPPNSPHQAIADELSNTHSCLTAATFPESHKTTLSSRPERWN